ncbi:helix-turn-helix domain-containing protein [Sneathiella aquimaris]|uniref:helix-turn-helix domain-containing protein n=1 Tax=Sneathiella aquimaris TaxID=2599305 RepID=UPI00146E5E7F|nr:helix-turn-helix domain-containing protein [Sneathiella aquimaris]
MAKQKELPLEDEAQKRLNLTISDDEKSDPDKGGQSATETVKEQVVDFSSDDASYDHEEDVYIRVGDRLRLAREAKELSLHDVAEQLRLRPRQIQAIENSDYASLPGQAFVTGFLRSYANAVGLDAVELVKLYRLEHDGNLHTPELTFPEPTSEGKMPRGSLLIGTCLAAAVVFGGWFYYLGGDKADIELVPDLPDRLASKLETFLQTENLETEKGTAASPATDGDAIGQNNGNDLAALFDKTSEPENGISRSPTMLEPTPSVPLVESAPVAAESLADQSPPVSGAANQEVLSTDSETVQAEAEGLLKTTAPQKTEVSSTEKTELSSAEQDNQIDRSEKEMPKSVDSEATDVVVSEPAVTVSLEEKSVPITKNSEKLADAENTETVVGSDVASLLSDQQAEASFPQTVLTVKNDPSAEETSSPAPEALGVENSDARIVLRAQEEAWVQVLDKDATVIFDGVMENGDSYMVPLKPGLTLSASNAAAIEIRLDGSVLGVLGRYGDIIRKLSLEPAEIQKKMSSSN